MNRILSSGPLLSAAGLFILLAMACRLAQGAALGVAFPAQPLVCPGLKIFSAAEEGGAMPARYLYQAGFEAGQWSGTLEKIAISRDASGAWQAPTEGRPIWEAGAILTGTLERAAPAYQMGPSPSGRNIFTSRSSIGSRFETVRFDWSALNAQQQAWLDLSPYKHAADGMGQARLNYLRGARELEADRPNGLFRVRKSVLGDIVNSVPLYVEPRAGATAASGNGRRAAVYVAANDGMLHAFDAEDGHELFAYVPNALLPLLNRLTSPGYRHQAFADGEIAVAHAQAGGKWKTVLAAGMGGGAQGLFALDVSDPANFAGGNGALFEFTDADDADIGNIVSAPAIARFKVSERNGIPEYKYFVVAASGYNNYVNDGPGRFDSKAPGALFLLSLDKGSAEKWELNVNYYKFKTPFREAGVPSALAQPALVNGADGAVSFAYAGDLQGRLWRFDFRGNAPWGNALGTGVPKPLFAASDGKGMRQPISMRPRVAYAPQGGYVVLFGTGKFIEEADAAPENFEMQSFYGIYDTTHSGYAASGRAELAPRTATASQQAGQEVLEIAGKPFAYGTKEPGKKGWYVDFPASERTGERSVATPVLASGMLLFHTLMPGPGSCAAGKGRSYILDPLSGLPADGRPTGMLAAAGLPARPVFIAIDSVSAGADAFGRRMIKKRYIPLGPKEPGQGPAPDSTPNPPVLQEKQVRSGRLSWREIINWQEMHDAAAGR